VTRAPARTLLVPLVTVLAALLLGLFGAGSAAAQAAPAANPSGFVRLGHLAPDVGPVDVYLAPFGGAQQSVITKAPYGSLTAYQTLTPGDYTVAMRPAGTPATTAPMLSSQVTVAAGAAYTVLATGRMGALSTSVITDDLTPPPPNASRVRLIQGSTKAQDLTVEAVGGPTLARGLAYGTATGYANVPQGRWTLKVTAPDGSSAMASAPVVDLTAGSVNSLLITDTPSGGFAVTPVVDAAGINTAMAPAGGVETGAGGTATRIINPSVTTSSSSTAAILGGGVLLAAAGAVLARRRTVAARA
jgi:hypothetical protein